MTYYSLSSQKLPLAKFEEISYNGHMKIREALDGSGIYRVPCSQVGPKTWFVRDPKKSKDGEVAPLLHICDRDTDPNAATPTLVIMTDPVRWDSFHGHYYCTGCKQTWKDEVGLRAIWEDGYGTGDEGRA